MYRSIAILLFCIWLPANASDLVESLHAAAKSGDIETIRKLITAGVDVNAVKAGDGGTPLLTATNWNNFEAVKVLISLGGDVNFKVGQWTPLMRAVGRDTRIVKLLIEAGADVNYADPKFRYTPLSYAAGNRPETFERLTKSGGYVGPFPNSTETVRLLIKAGAILNHVDTFSESPLRIAIRTNNTEIARLLLQEGADVNQRISAEFGAQRGDTVLMEAIAYYSVFKDVSAIKLLLGFKANPNDRNERDYDEYSEGRGGQWQGYSVLCYAAKNGFLDVVKLLLEHGADPKLPRTDGKTAYELALQNKHAKTAELVNTYAQRKTKAP
ncbi:MAG: ankyrin repeat domain-containing protein [Gallionella sp.]|nr:ankyrin repeat domain-containing protein [Gallionella sp.]